jgi:hypothetical protein
MHFLHSVFSRLLGFTLSFEQDCKGVEKLTGSRVPCKVADVSTGF